MIDLVPQICGQCPDRDPKPITGQWDGWGREGNLTMYEMGCGHRFLLHTRST